MWPAIPVLAIVLAQAQPNVTSKWCFERGQGAQLCEATETACNQLLDLNREIAIGPCKQVELPPPPTPEKQTLPKPQT